MDWAHAAELRVHVVDLQEVLEHDGVAVLALQPGNDALLLGGETLQCPHGGLQGCPRRPLGFLLGRADGLRVLALQLTVVIPEPCDLLP